MNLNELSQSSRTKVPFEFIKASLLYNEATGNLHWKVGITNLGIDTGAVAGSKEERYVRIKIQGVKYPAHVVAWYLQTGEWCMERLDHIDRNGLNNKWNNLRIATKSHNQFNRRQKPGATAPLPGVRFNGGKWEVSVAAQYLGRVESLFDAAALRISKLNALGVVA